MSIAKSWGARTPSAPRFLRLCFKVINFHSVTLVLNHNAKSDYGYLINFLYVHQANVWSQMSEKTKTIVRDLQDDGKSGKEWLSESINDVHQAHRKRGR